MWNREVTSWMSPSPIFFFTWSESLCHFFIRYLIWLLCVVAWCVSPWAVSLASLPCFTVLYFLCCFLICIPQVITASSSMSLLQLSLLCHYLTNIPLDVNQCNLQRPVATQSLLLFTNVPSLVSLSHLYLLLFLTKNYPTKLCSQFNQYFQNSCIYPNYVPCVTTQTVLPLLLINVICILYVSQWLAPASLPDIYPLCFHQICFPCLVAQSPCVIARFCCFLDLHPLPDMHPACCYPVCPLCHFPDLHPLCLTDRLQDGSAAYPRNTWH